ncbi:MAG: pyruvate formate lyase family protein, partial [Promethearchaeota archaeon]
MTILDYRVVPLQGIPSDRVLKIRDRMLSMPRELDIERARCYTRIWKQMLDSPPCMRDAKALEEFLRCIPIRIDDDELLVGVKSSKVRADPFEIERGMHVNLLDVIFDDRLKTRLTKGFLGLAGKVNKSANAASDLIFHALDRYVPLPEQEINELKNEIIPFWKDKTLSSRKLEVLREAGLYTDAAGPMAEMLNSFLAQNPDTYTLAADTQGHVVPGFRRVLKIG